MQIKLLALLLAFQGFVFADQQSQVSCDLLTQQLKNEYAAYYELCSDTLLNFDIITYLIIAEQQKNTCPVLYNMVQDIANKLSLAMPQILISKNPIANAFAMQDDMFPNGRIILGSDLIDDLEYGLNYDELRAIVAHELAHLKHQHVPKKKLVINRSLKVTIGLLVAVALLSKSFPYIYEKLNITDYQFKVMGKNIPSLTKYNLITYFTQQGLFATSYLAFSLFFQKFCRAQEKEADMTLIGVIKDPLVLINALNKLSNLGRLLNPKLYTFMHSLPNSLMSHPTEVEREKYLKAAVTKMNS